MGKILSQSGISLADAYDVEGSIVGVEELESQGVKLVHEMGATMLSERLQGFFVKMESTVAQNAFWTLSSGAAITFADSPNRILGISIVIPAANAGDVTHCSLSIQNALLDRELLIHTWDSGDDPEVRVRFNDDGAGIASFLELRPAVSNIPQLMVRLGEGPIMPNLRFAGGTSGFGAGTVVVTAIIHLCRANPETPAPGAPSSHGLPLPSW